MTNMVNNKKYEIQSHRGFEGKSSKLKIQNTIFLYISQFNNTIIIIMEYCHQTKNMQLGNVTFFPWQNRRDEYIQLIHSVSCLLLTNPTKFDKN